MSYLRQMRCAAMQNLPEGGKFLIEVLDQHLRLMQLFRIPSGELDPLARLFRGQSIIAAGHPSVSQFAIRKGLHGDFTRFLLARCPNSISPLVPFFPSATCIGRRAAGLSASRSNPLK
jgi:hypothetical protein